MKNRVPRSGSATPFWRKILGPLLLVIGAIILGLAIAWVPLPYVVHSPGPTFNVLGTQGDQKIIEVEGADEEASGELRMVTISEQGGPGSSVTLPTVLHGLVTAGYAVKPYGQVYPKGVTAEQVQEVSATQMRSSHSTASVAALELLDYELPTVITVIAIAEGSGADGKIEAGDELVSIRVPGGATYPMDRPSAPFALMRTIPVGTELEVTVLRGGVELVETVRSVADMENPEELQEGSKLGIILDLDIDMPLEIMFHLEKVGGPSAGMVFALGIIDELTGGGLTGGKTIAGTGALHYDGTVEPIGGIEQKLYGAVRDGANWFLAPKMNCDGVVGRVPKGLNVVAVGTLEEALFAVESIAAGDTEELPTCEETAPRS